MSDSASLWGKKVTDEPKSVLITLVKHYTKGLSAQSNIIQSNLNN